MQWRHTSRSGVSSGPEPRLPPHLVPVAGAVVVALAVAVVVWAPGGRPLSADLGAAARRTHASAYHANATTTAAPDPEVRPLLPTVTSPLRVLEIGDSLGIDLGDQLQSQLDATGLARTTMASMGDSGLVNATFYDWPAALATLLATEHPQVVVVFIGANDDQGLDIDGAVAVPGTPAWDAAYAQRVDAVLSEATNAGARVVWVGMPPMADPGLNAAMQHEDTIFQRQTETFPGTLYVSSTSVLGNVSGQFVASGVDVSGQPVALRTPDGVHLTPAGASALAGIVIDTLDTRWHLPFQTPAVAGPSKPRSSPIMTRPWPWLLRPR